MSLTEKYEQAQNKLQEQRLQLEERQIETKDLYVKINRLETELNLEKYEARQLGETDVQNKKEIQNLKNQLQERERKKGEEILKLEEQYKKHLQQSEMTEDKKEKQTG